MRNILLSQENVKKFACREKILSYTEKVFFLFISNVFFNWKICFKVRKNVFKYLISSNKRRIWEVK